MPRQGLLLRLVVLASVAGAIAFVTVNRDKFDPAGLDAWLSGMGIWAPVAYVAIYAAGTVAFAPGALFALAGGAMFGPVLGTILNLAGATIGAGISFLIARYVAGDWVRRKAGGRLKRLIDGVESEGWRFVAFVRLVPLFPFNLSNYAFGLTRIPFVSYVVTSFITMAPGALAYTWLGHAGREALGGNGSAIRYGLLALGLLAAIAFLPRLIGRLRANDVAWIEPGDLPGKIDSGAPPIIVDVRGRDEFTGPLGHIPGAINIPLGELHAGQGALQGDPEATIVLVCRTDKRSAAAARQLQTSGFADIRVLRGGMERWNSLGLEIVLAR
ncbi:MAG: VTT domain-containing protein [Oricola sp.]